MSFTLRSLLCMMDSEEILDGYMPFLENNFFGGIHQRLLESRVFELAGGGRRNTHTGKAMNIVGARSTTEYSGRKVAAAGYRYVDLAPEDNLAALKI